MEHYKSRNNDFFHFTNPHDDRSELDDDEYDELQYEDVDDDRSRDFNFHTFHPLGIARSPPPNFQTSGMMNQNDALTSSNGELGTFDNGDLIIEIEHTMKNLSDKLQSTIEGIGTQIARLEDKTCKLDKNVEDVKNSAERYHGTAHRKLRQMQNILQEVQDGVLFLRDKHEIAETQLQLAKLQHSKQNQTNTSQTNPQHQLPLPASHSSSHIRFSTPLNQLPLKEAAFSPSLSCIPPNYQSETPHQNKTNPQFPHFTQSCQLNPPLSLQNQPFLTHHSLETPNEPSYSYSQPATWVSPQEHEAGSPELTHAQSSRNYKSEFHAEYMPESASFSYFEPPFSLEMSNMKPEKLSYTHAPMAKELPHALPTASYVEDESSSEENSRTIRADDIIEKVTAMGFRRDLVKASVRKLTENGSSLDLNMVLDRMMNSA